jgi:hypothetical protein
MLGLVKEKECMGTYEIPSCFSVGIAEFIMGGSYEEDFGFRGRNGWGRLIWIILGGKRDGENCRFKWT